MWLYLSGIYEEEGREELNGGLPVGYLSKIGNTLLTNTFDELIQVDKYPKSLKIFSVEKPGQHKMKFL